MSFSIVRGFRLRARSVMKNGKQNFPASSPVFVRTPSMVAMMSTSVRTSQRRFGAVITKRSISEPGCVAYMASVFETVTMRSPGIQRIYDTNSCAFLKSPISCSFGRCFTPIRDSRVGKWSWRGKGGGSY